jgi:4-amino-4-deoxy-L-arabinose transferase-like glycosyltransferase
VIAVFALALVLRIGAIAVVGFTSVSFGDAEAYMKTAEVVLASRAYPDGVEPLPVFRAPGYPAFLIASTLGHPRAVAADKLWNALLGALTAVLLARLAGRISGSRSVAMTAGLLAAVNPAFVYLATDVQSENLTILLLVLFAGELLSATDSGSRRSALAAGALLGFAALTRPVCLVLAPLLLAPLLARGPGRLRRGAAAAAGLVLALVPWTLRNAERYGAFLPVNDQFGVVFWLGNTEINERYYRLESRAEYEEFTRHYQAEVNDGRIREIAASHPGPAERSAAFVRDAGAWIESHPGRWRALVVEKTLDWLRPWASRFGWPPGIVAATGLWYVTLFVLAGLGMFRGKRRGLVAAAVLVLFLSTAAHVATLVVWRYRMVFWDPLLIVFASAALVELFGGAFSGRTWAGRSPAARPAGSTAPRP